MHRLAERVALITGAASGMGAATAHRLAAEGASVMVTDIEDTGGERVAKEIIAAGGRGAYHHLDVVSESEWEQTVKDTIGEFGGIDILVNNAGIVGPETIEETSLELWSKYIGVLQTGAFLGMKYALSALRASEHASVINISSVFAASGGFGRAPAYHAAKGAIRSLTKTMALGWAADGIRVNSIHPGFIATPMAALATDEVHRAMIDMTPMGRLGEAAEIAAGIAYLASDDASFVTGTELYIDGGYMAR